MVVLLAIPATQETKAGGLQDWWKLARSCLGLEAIKLDWTNKQTKSQTFKYCEIFINYKMPYETCGKLNNNEENLHHEHLSKIVYAFFWSRFSYSQCWPWSPDIASIS